MRKLVLTLLTAVAMVAMAKSDLKLRDLTSGVYYPQQIYGVEASADGENYTQISDDGQQIVKYSFKDARQVEVVFDCATARGEQVKRVEGYIMSPDESHILIQTKTQKIYRHSFTAEYYLYNVKNKTLVPLSANGPQQVPLFSPDGTMVAFVRDNNLFLVKLLFNNSESQVTKDGKRNEILNGIPDWVNEEEFTYARAFDFSADSKMLGWIRYDERKVPTFSFPMYRGMMPAFKDYAEYPGAYTYKYPVAGAQNATVSVKTYDIKSHQTYDMKLPLEADGYIPRIQFTSDASKLAIMTLNRHQDRLDIYMANPRSTECKLVVRDHIDKYVKEEAYGNIRFYNDRFVLMSERDGYNHLYLYNLNGQLQGQVTKGKFVVTDFYGYDEPTKTFYYATNEEAPYRQAVYSTTLGGKTRKLSTRVGTNQATFSKNFKYFMNVYSSIQTPHITTLCNNQGKELKVLVDNKALVDKLADVTLGEKELFSFTTSEGVQLNGWMVKPANFDASKKYPVILFQYSGPGSQQVHDQWNIGNMTGALFEEYLASLGFISVCVDGRGTGGRGAEFEKCTYLNLGAKESTDQAEVAIYMGSLPYVDKANIGIWGWSFGGFNTLMSLSEGRNVFRAGVAVAPPTDWRYYDSVYTERYMRTPKENESGYNCNPIQRAKQLHGDLLICHGLADDNVHFRNVAEYSEALVQANKEFEMATYTNRNHSIYGGNTRYHLYNKIAKFFVRNLK